LAWCLTNHSHCAAVTHILTVQSIQPVWLYVTDIWTVRS
jgi:hypothetical protein